MSCKSNLIFLILPQICEIIMMFLRKLNSFIESQTTLDKGDSLLVAISGGIDSVVLLDMLVKAGYKCSLAHCNFHLRGEASNADERFVRELAKVYDLPLFVEHFDTFEVAQSQGISIEMAARDLRYDWFGKLRNEHNFKAIAVAHHKNDNAETLLLNLARGAGLRGIAGIKAERGSIVRPLLCFDRAEMEIYAKINGLKYCIDHTNADTSFHRNRIRHNILPEFEKINPNFVSQIERFTRIVGEYNDFFDQEIDRYVVEVVDFKPNITTIDVLKLKQSRFARLILFEIVQRLELPSTFTDRLYQLIDKQSGRKVVFGDKLIFKDRDKILITNNDEDLPSHYQIPENTTAIYTPIALKFEYLDASTLTSLRCESHIALLDKAKISFPLCVRRWQAGDKFKPLGMNQFQKVSDFLTNIKTDLATKNRTFALLDAKGDIVWVINNRIDNRFKIDNNTDNVLKITYLQTDNYNNIINK